MLPEFEEVVDRLSENYSGFVDLIDPETEKDYDAIVNFKRNITELLNGAKGARTGLLLFQDAAIEIEKKRISRDLTRASRRQSEALRGVISNVERVEAFCNNILAMVDLRFKSKDKDRGAEHTA